MAFTIMRLNLGTGQRVENNMNIRQISMFAVAVVFTASTIVSLFTLNASAQSLKPVYSTNNILYYAQPTCEIGQNEGTTALVGNDNLEKILRYYVGKGLTLAQASGIAGNYQQESGFNPAIIQGGAIAGPDYKPVSGVGFGIAQWTFPSRQDPLVALAQSSSRPIIDLGLQLDYSWQEMETGKGHRMKLAEFKATTTPEDAAYVFHRDYEVSADSEAFVKRVRGGNAINIYNQYKASIPDGSTQPSAGTGTGTATSTEVCTGDGSASPYANNQFKIYNQNDPKWANEPYGKSTIGAAGCGPAAMAMIITAFKGNEVTPSQTAAYGAANGTLRDEGLKGSLTNVHSVIGGNWGLKSSQLKPDVAIINSALRDGALIVVSGEGSAPFIPEGHYIVIRGVTATGKWLIGDSNGAIGIENSKKEWDPAEIIVKMHINNIWAMRK